MRAFESLEQIRLLTTVSIAIPDTIEVRDAKPVHDVTGDGKLDIVVNGTERVDGTLLKYVVLVKSEDLVEGQSIGLAQAIPIPLFGGRGFVWDENHPVASPEQVYVSSSEGGLLRAFDMAHQESNHSLYEPALDDLLDLGGGDRFQISSDVHGYDNNFVDDVPGYSVATQQMGDRLLLEFHQNEPPVEADWSVRIQDGFFAERAFSVGDSNHDGLDDLAVKIVSDDSLIGHYYDIHSLTGVLHTGVDFTDENGEPYEPQESHPFDFNGDGLEDQLFADDVRVFVQFAVPDFDCEEGRTPADATGDGAVGFDDFLRLSSNFGKSDGPTYEDGDFDCNGRVEFVDFLMLSDAFGT